MWNLLVFSLMHSMCVDVTVRMSSADALQHHWMDSSSSSNSHDKELAVAKTKLKRYVIKKRWIKAVNTIIALHRMGAKIDFNLV